MITPTEQDRKNWANSTCVQRAEVGGLVYELNDNDKIYVLKRETVSPKKAGQSGMLQLSGVIINPGQKLLDQIKDRNEI
jgi:hypothetical protein